MLATPRPAPRGFTLVELLVVIAIVALISAVALPVVLPALNERKVSEGARILQAVLAGARDTAVRAGDKRGVRFLVDPIFSGGPGQPLASNRMIAIEPASDYTEGFVRVPVATTYPPPAYPILPNPIADPAFYIEDTSPTTVITGNHLRISSSPYSGAISNSPTGWSSNIRQGDKIRFQGSGNYYTIAGPVAPPSPYKVANAYDSYIATTNPERYITCTLTSTLIATPANLGSWRAEYLNLTNGFDDDGDGWIDEGCDGIDNDGDGVIDPGFNGKDDDGDKLVDEADEVHFNGDGEFEAETFKGSLASLAMPDNLPYVIYRQPVVSPGSRETALPDGIVIDLTTWDASAATVGTLGPTLPERSRLPVDPYTGYVDIMIAPNGQVVLPGVGGGGNFARTPIANSPFYHFWLTEREGINGVLWDPTPVASPYPGPQPNPRASANKPQTYLLPMPQGTLNYVTMPDSVKDTSKTYSTNPVFLTGRRRLVTLFARTGQIATTSIEVFDANDTNRPFYDAQAGIKEPQ